MIYPDNVSFEGFYEKIDEYYRQHPSDICDPPISAQFALDLIFKTLIDDKVHYSYLTTIPEGSEQINSIQLDLILTKYSRKYRKFKKRRRRATHK